MGDWRGTWAARGQRIAAAPLAPAVAGALLGVLAVAGTLARAAGTAAAPGPTRLALVLAALATTMPLGLLWAQARPWPPRRSPPRPWSRSRPSTR